MTELILYVLALIICGTLIVFLLIQIRKLWKMRYTLEKFYTYLHALDKQLQVLDNIFIKSEKKATTPKDKLSTKVNICEFCQNLKMYVPPKSEKIFVYKCELHHREVNLKESCDSFKKDVLNSKI